MNAKITASDPGSSLLADPRSQNFNRSKRPHVQDTGARDGESDHLTTDAPLSRYTAADRPQGAEVANAISLSQTQEGFLEMVRKALDRMEEICVFCQDVADRSPERKHYTSEFTQLQNFISDIGTKQFNGVALFSETPLQITPAGGGPNVSLNAIDFNASGPNGGLAAAFDPRSTELQGADRAAAAQATIRQAAENLGVLRTKVGANLRRLSLSSDQLFVLNQNLSAASAAAQDMDAIRHLAQLARFKILGQAGAAMMAQANALPQAALRLLD